MGRLLLGFLRASLSTTAHIRSEVTRALSSSATETLFSLTGHPLLHVGGSFPPLDSLVQLAYIHQWADQDLFVLDPCHSSPLLSSSRAEPRRGPLELSLKRQVSLVQRRPREAHQKARACRACRVRGFHWQVGIETTGKARP